MALWDALLASVFGRTRLPRPDMDRIFALAAAAPSLPDAELQFDGRAAVCLKPVEGGEFAAADREIQALVQLAANSPDFHGKAKSQQDALGYRWIRFDDDDLGECVNLIHLAGSTLQEKGYGEQLLVAGFRFHLGPEAACGYLLYNYKRGRFYPFVPSGGDGQRTRDHAAEFRASGALGSLLPMEQDISRWFPLWELPL